MLLESGLSGRSDGSEGVESVFGGICDAGEVIDSDIAEAGGFEAGFFRTGEAGLAGGIQNKNAGVFGSDGICRTAIGAVTGEKTFDIGFDFGKVADAGGGIDIRDAVDGAVGEERFGLEEGSFGDIFPIYGSSEMSESFDFANTEISAEIIAESVGEADEITNRKAVLHDFIFDAKENLLLRSAAREITMLGAVASASESDSVLAT